LRRLKLQMNERGERTKGDVWKRKEKRGEVSGKIEGFRWRFLSGNFG
jgi:hypothetical protein